MYNISVEKTGGTPWYSIHMLLQRKRVELMVQCSRVIAEKGGGTEGTVFMCYWREKGWKSGYSIHVLLQRKGVELRVQYLCVIGERRG